MYSLYTKRYVLLLSLYLGLRVLKRGCAFRLYYLSLILELLGYIRPSALQNGTNLFRSVLQNGSYAQILRLLGIDWFRILFSHCAATHLLNIAGQSSLNKED